MSFKDYQSIFLHAICDMHEHMKYTLCEEEIARFCDIRIIEGKTNEGGSGPPSIVQYVNTRSGQRNRFSILHEIAHVIMQRMNLEEPLIKQGVARGLDGMGFVEATANKAASLLLIPDTSIESATIFWGYHANAVLDLSDTCNASLEATAYRCPCAEQWERLKKKNNMSEPKKEGRRHCLYAYATAFLASTLLAFYHLCNPVATLDWCQLSPPPHEVIRYAD